MSRSEHDPDGRIKLEQRGHLLLIGIDRPEKRNGFTPKMFAELAAAYTRLETDPGLRCGVLHAEGDHFTAGLDMPKCAPVRKEGRPYIPPAEVDPFNLREPIRTKPMVIALKGISFTVAIELMLASDIAIAAENCRFSQIEVKRGIMAGCGATFRFAERAGWGNAMKLLLTGDEFGAAEALRFNFVQEVVPVGQELERAIEIAERICKQAPLAVQATMENGRIALTYGWQAAYAKIANTQRRLYNTEDAREGVQSFVEKREARFVGR
ncbi:MAG: crotonase/enoyl-CoA hydratase family protein [Azonexus sp.]|jgi:enoyl-CoA hydratase/carnithine racemase|nr:crotonase/enoyl-CoA hydratase family protein [Azonexus sp.]